MNRKQQVCKKYEKYNYVEIHYYVETMKLKNNLLVWYCMCVSVAINNDQKKYWIQTIENKKLLNA